MVVLGLTILAVSAAGQSPTPAPAVTVAFDDDAGSISVERPGEFSLTVTNGAQSSPPPFNDQNTADVTVDVSGAMVGWSAAVEPAHFRLAPGASQKVTLTVAVGPDAADSKITLTVSATLKTPLERLDPILGTIPGGEQTATASDTLEVTRNDSLTRGVLEAIGPWIYLVLLVMVAAVLVAVGLTVSARRSLVRLGSEVHDLPVPPGGRIVFPIHVEGLAKETDTVLLQVSTVAEGWAAFLPVAELTLEPGESKDMTLVVIAPKEAATDARQQILVTATSAKAPRAQASLEFVALVEGASPTGASLKAPKRRKN